MTDETQHDSLPYILDGLDITTPEDSGFAIIAHVNPDTKDGGKSRGAFIVRACNNHYGLLEALELTIKWAERHGLDTAPLISGQSGEVPVIAKARSAIAKVRGQS